jgi:hypothetical protein
MPVFVGGPLVSVAHSGVVNTRTTLKVGRAWEEFFNFKFDEDGKEFVAQLNNYWNRATSLDVVHQSFLTTLGAGGGTPLVNGASQTGSSIITDGWPDSTVVLKAGDLVQFASITLVYDVTADVTSDGSGNATIPISPNIFSGGSPANNAAITITASVLFRAKILERPRIPVAKADEWLAGLRVAFLETP